MPKLIEENKNANEYDYSFVIGIHGKKENQSVLKETWLEKEGIGKSSLIQRFMADSFSAGYPYCSTDNGGKILIIDDKKVKLHLYKDSYLVRNPRHCDCNIVLFDCTDVASFNNAQQIINDSRFKNTLVVLVGTKLDLTSKKLVDYNTAKQFANQHDLSFFEVSSKNSHNVSELFRCLAKNLIIQQNIKDNEIKYQKHINALTSYIQQRETEPEFHWKARFFSCGKNIDAISKHAKIAAAKKVIEELRTGKEPSYSEEELKTLHDGRLGKIIKNIHNELKHPFKEVFSNKNTFMMS
ncbi:Ras family GTPase [Legionella gratiana]|uniref:Ras family GTPase n=1 Tax=Legionella gratiana TaxID=45066 RepID=A0A378JDS6_9GAMM|nr:Rab family GTPase [Legionella gratiana]KTD13726.1 Ras family GTPase [Legionella gratiana]STX45963.1 Ras family GTPase [Legionella gratiana]